MGKPLTAMPGLTRDGVLGKWIWQLAEEDALPLEEIAQGLPVSICVSLSYLDANLRILIAIIMYMFTRFSLLFPRFAAEEGLRCASTVSRYLTLVIYRLICAVRTDSVARFMVKRLARHCSCEVLMIPAIAGNARWKSCAIRRLSII